MLTTQQRVRQGRERDSVRPSANAVGTLWLSGMKKDFKEAIAFYSILEPQTLCAGEQKQIKFVSRPPYHCLTRACILHSSQAKLFALSIMLSINFHLQLFALSTWITSFPSTVSNWLNLIMFQDSCQGSSFPECSP